MNIWENIKNKHCCPSIVAEIGINHGGDLNEAFRLMDLAQDSGADLVKLQCFDPYQFISPSSPYFDIFRNCQLTSIQIKELFFYADKQKIDLFASVFDFSSLKILEDLGCNLYKIASGDVTHHELIRAVGNTGKPVIASSGCSTLNEILALSSLIPEGNLAVLHCVSEYPAHAVNLNLNAMQSISEQMSVPVGFSDHTKGVSAAIAAVALGARVIEKHFTSDKKNVGPDHALSADPHEFKTMATGIKQAFSALGSQEKSVVEGTATRVAIRRSIYAAKNLRAGDRLTLNDLHFLRPGDGLCASAAHQVVGKTIKQDLDAGAPVKLEMLRV